MSEQSIPSRRDSGGGRASRRDFLKGAASVGASVAGATTLGGAAIGTSVGAAPVRSAVSQPPPVPVRVAVLCAGFQQPFHARFQQELDRLGGSGRYVADFTYAEGKGNPGNMASLAGAIVSQHPRVIVVADTPSAVAARDATVQASPGSEADRIPVVITIVSNPDLAPQGIDPLIESHLKGIADHADRDIDGSRDVRVCILKEVLGLSETDTIAVIYNVDNPGKVRELHYIGEWAREINIRRVGVAEPPSLPGQAPDWVPNIQAALNRLQRSGPFPVPLVQAAVVVEEPTVFYHRHLIRQRLRAMRIPEMWESADSLTDGGLFCYGPTRTDAWYWAAQKVHQIISTNDRPPLDPPQFESLEFRLYYNPTVADQLGIRISEGDVFCGIEARPLPEDLAALPPSQTTPWPPYDPDGPHS